MEASSEPGRLKFIRPAMKFLLRMSFVVARKPAVLIEELGPNRMPSRLTTNTRPLAFSVPSIWEGRSPPMTRLRITADELGCTNVVVSFLPMLNEFQLMIARLEDWLMLTVPVPAPVTVAAPPTRAG